MKLFISLPLLIISFATASAESPAGTPSNASVPNFDPTKIVVSERPTHADLKKKQDKQAKDKHERKNGHKHGKATEKPIKPLVTIKKRTLMGHSTIIASGGHWTIVPRGAIIHLPPRLKDKVVTKPQGKLLDWPVFLRKNYGWIHLHSVSMKQAHGADVIGVEVGKAYKSIGKLVISTCGGHPISLNPDALKALEAEEKKKK